MVFSMNDSIRLDGKKVFESERVIGRRWLRSDLAAITKIYSDPDVVRWIGRGNVISQEQAKAWLDVTATNYRERGYGMFALLDRAGGDTIGFAGLVHPANQPEAELKYAFDKSRWGQGLASEAIPVVLDYAAVELNITLITATVAPGNEVSQRVLLKAGFIFVAQRFDDEGDREFYYEWRASAQP